MSKFHHTFSFFVDRFALCVIFKYSYTNRYVLVLLLLRDVNTTFHNHVKARATPVYQKAHSTIWTRGHISKY